MNNLYLVYILKRHYLENIVNESDLEDIRVYTICDYTIGELKNENFYILTGNFKNQEIIRQEYYYDEDYFIIIDKKISKQEEINNLTKLRYQKLYKLQSNYYMTMYNVFSKVEDIDAIKYINDTLKRKIKKENRKVISFGEIIRN